MKLFLFQGLPIKRDKKPFPFQGLPLKREEEGVRILMR